MPRTPDMKNAAGGHTGRVPSLPAQIPEISERQSDGTDHSTPHRR
jgi:hypothetical protein